MSKVVATTVLPEDTGEVLTFGDTGDAIAISGDSLNVNVIQDAGGNNIITSDGAGNLTVPSGLGGAMNLLTTNTFTDQASSSFTTLIDSTYDVYKFTFNAINLATDGTQKFTFQGSINGGSSYGITKTTTVYTAWNSEAGSNTFEYNGGWDQAQSTTAQFLMTDMGNGADECGAGELFLFNPSSTAYVKQFFARTNYYMYTDQSVSQFTAGMLETKSAINAMQFSTTSGNFDGEIKMYGISKS